MSRKIKENKIEMPLTLCYMLKGKIGNTITTNKNTKLTEYRELASNPHERNLVVG